jgi:tRNA threonylcarbamoyladenosine biosynthesis protein TsaB
LHGSRSESIWKYIVKILSIDTTSERGSLALVRDSAVVEELSLHAPDGFGHVLFPTILDLLARHGLTVPDMDGFASATGPGTFTGVRIGLTAAKGLAESAGKPVAGVSNLKAMAFYGEAHTRAVLLDARRKDVYAAVYDSSLRLVSPEVVMPFGEWLASLQLVPEEYLSQDFSAYEGIGSTGGFENRRRLVPWALAGAIGLIAASEGGAFVDPAALDANYVRKTDAELAWKEV